MSMLSSAKRSMPLEESKTKDNPFRAQALLALARVQAAQGKKTEALASYDLVIKDFSGSEFEKQAKLLKELAL
jgi:TolA-binding protein